MPNPNPQWFPVPINFNANPPTCAQVTMPGKGPDGKHPFDGIKFISNKTSCKFTGIDIVCDHPDEWPQATISEDGLVMTQEDLYLDTAPAEHAYKIFYTEDGVAKSFDPGIKNQD